MVNYSFMDKALAEKLYDVYEGKDKKSKSKKKVEDLSSFFIDSLQGCSCQSPYDSTNKAGEGNNGNPYPFLPISNVKGKDIA